MRRRVGLATLGVLAALWAASPGRAQTPTPPGPEPGARSLPINLASALQLAQARAIDVQVAAERVNAAAAQLDRARSRWLPTLYLGADYAYHNGRLQDIVGNVLTTRRESFMF